MAPTYGRRAASATGKQEVLRAVASVASDIRSALGDTASAFARLTPSGHDGVTRGASELFDRQQFYSSGKFEEAVKQYNRSIEQDKNFGRAYAGLANTYYFMGRKEEAEENYKIALSLMDRMTLREKYRTQGGYFFAVARNYEKAIDTYRCC